MCISCWLGFSVVVVSRLRRRNPSASPMVCLESQNKPIQSPQPHSTEHEAAPACSFQASHLREQHPISIRRQPAAHHGPGSGRRGLPRVARSRPEVTFEAPLANSCSPNASGRRRRSWRGGDIYGELLRRARRGLVSAKRPFGERCSPRRRGAQRPGRVMCSY